MPKEIEKYRSRGPAVLEAQDNLGRTIDRVDSLIGALALPMPDKFHIEQLKSILPDVSADLKKYFAEATGENPWSD
jgi:hypothetical protein